MISEFPLPGESTYFLPHARARRLNIWAMAIDFTLPYAHAGR